MLSNVCLLILGLSLSAFAMPLILESELSPATAEQGTLTDSKSAGTVTEAPRLYSTCRGLSCRDMNRNVEDHRDKNRQGQNHQEMKRCGDDRHEKKRCGGKNQQNKPCGKNQNQNPCGENQCEKRCGKSQGKKHRVGKRSVQSRHDTTNCNRQDNRKNNMENGNERRQLVVDNKAKYRRIGKSTTIQQRPESSSNIYIYIDGNLDQKRSAWRWFCLYMFVIIVFMVVLLTFFYYNFDLGFYCVDLEGTELLSGN